MLRARCSAPLTEETTRVIHESRQAGADLVYFRSLLVRHCISWAIQIPTHRGTGIALRSAMMSSHLRTPGLDSRVSCGQDLGPNLSLSPET